MPVPYGLLLVITELSLVAPTRHVLRLYKKHQGVLFHSESNVSHGLDGERIVWLCLLIESRCRIDVKICVTPTSSGWYRKGMYQAVFWQGTLV